MRPVISVVVPMLNASGHVGVLMDSLANQRFEQPWELIAVDNGSDDDTVAVVRTRLSSPFHPQLIRGEVVVIPSPRGYASPRNAGVERASAPLLAFCDADGAVDERWLARMVDSLGRHPLVASRKFRTHDVAARSTVRGVLEVNELSTVLGFNVALTAGLGCTRELFDSLGGFDPHFDLGGEDVDFSMRAKITRGIEPVMEHEAIYWSHLPSGSRSSLAKGYRDGRGHVRLYQRHLGHHSEPPSRLSAVVLRVPKQLLRRLLRPVAGTGGGRGQPTIGIAWRVGVQIGRAVWSVRLGVRYF